MKTPHTPLPWHVSESNELSSDTRTIRGPNNESIIDYGMDGCASDPGSPYVCIKEVDAAFIVCACNSHDELLAAAKTAADFFEADGYCVDDLRSAIAKAEGAKP